MLDCGDNTLAIFIGLLINYTRYSLLSVADIPGEIMKVLENILSDNFENGTLLEVTLPQTTTAS